MLEYPPAVLGPIPSRLFRLPFWGGGVVTSTVFFATGGAEREGLGFGKGAEDSLIDGSGRECWTVAIERFPPGWRICDLGWEGAII